MISNINIKNLQINKSEQKKQEKIFLQELNLSGTNFLSDRWMKENPNKLSIYLNMYQDLFNSNNEIFDIGGGISILSKLLSMGNNYTLIDPLVNEPRSEILLNFLIANRIRHIENDWYEILEKQVKKESVVVANDFFPNIDQRIVAFLELAERKKFYFRITLTWYSFLKYYKVQRTDADEQMILAQFQEFDIEKILAKYIEKSRIDYVLNNATDSFFENQRKICILENL